MVSTVIDQRRELVEAMATGREAVSELSRRFGVSRQTAYKWSARYEAGDETTLHDLSRRPRNSPRQTPAEMVERICALRLAHPAWGGRKLHHRLKAMAVEGVPSPSAIRPVTASCQRIAG
jgi:transposase